MKGQKLYSRRGFNQLIVSAGLMGVAGIAQRPAFGTTSRYFTVQEFDGRHLFATPGGEPFFAISFNHIDSSAMRYPENIHLWQDRYGASEERWIKGRVAPDLKAWGFNSIGWNQEVVLRRAPLPLALAQLDTRPLQLGGDALLPQPGVLRGAPLETGAQMAGRLLARL